MARLVVIATDGIDAMRVRLEPELRNGVPRWYLNRSEYVKGTHKRRPVRVLYLGYPPNPTPGRLACAAWARANREKVTARVRRWQLANPERYAAQNKRAKAAMRARRAAEGQFTLPLESGTPTPVPARERA